ncbi:FtsK/SpoIIIE domain-containing protein [Kribbella italica]|uniref:S-DNA-T family DNA segregation ATPase FtsK/SpoIIIE n=1 Tax=Kribbella italica TaxID=1540520 RepID=A0A7W9JDI7_9ACTN|nr:FtsK/SpoIIIE domain-containing protein [Kribbella italica]MBB5840005.1 S-DNA-T family DNA segregation ATPase FtsK/SpoIIIE [Kribbella italica]
MRFIGRNNHDDNDHSGDQADDRDDAGQAMGEVVPLHRDPVTDDQDNENQDSQAAPRVQDVIAREVPAAESAAPADYDLDPDSDDGEPVAAVLRVDPVPGSVPGLFPWDRTDERREVLPLWLTDATTRKAAVVWAGDMVKHKAKFHAARTPLYAGRVAVRVPRGGVRVMRDYTRWVSDAETRPLRLEAVRKADALEHMKLAQKTADRQKARLAISGAVAVPVLAGLAVVVFAAPVPVAVLLAIGAASWLGVRGGTEDKPLIGRAVVTGKVPELTSDMVIRALGSLNNSLINNAVKSGRGITFPNPIHRDGPGWRADIDLPYGVTANDIMDKRKGLASALRRPLGCVWPEPDPDQHEGRLVLWVGDKDMAKSPATPWPLATKGKVSMFEAFAFATDQRGRMVTLLLMFGNMLIGAMPRFGKTFALRVVLLAAALDPTVEMYVYELKGTGDLDSLEQVAHRFHSGPGDDPALNATMAGLREVHAELETRAHALKRLPVDLRKENKVTPEIAAKRSWGLYPIVVAIDECQELFSDKTHGGEAEELCLAIIKRGPALGIMLVLATQRPDSDSLPTGVSANAGIRLCLRVMGQTENDMVLGTSSYKNGLRATEFSLKDKGIGILKGHADAHQTVRSYYIDGPQAEQIVKRARALREAAGTITGHAAGETPDVKAGPQFSLLDDIAAVMAPGEEQVHSEVICDRLEELRADVYKGWDATGLANALKPLKLKTDQVWAAGTDGKNANRRGIKRADLTKARATNTNTKRDDSEGGEATG